jgi:hypothetical protein
LEALGFSHQRILTPVNVLAISWAFNWHLLADEFAFARHDQPRIVLARTLLVELMALAVDLGEDQLTIVVHAIADGPVAHSVVEDHIFLEGAGIKIGLRRSDNDATLRRSVIGFIG